MSYTNFLESINEQGEITKFILIKNNKNETVKIDIPSRPKFIWDIDKEKLKYDILFNQYLT